MERWAKQMGLGPSTRKKGVRNDRGVRGAGEAQAFKGHCVEPPPIPPPPPPCTNKYRINRIRAKCILNPNALGSRKSCQVMLSHAKLCFLMQNKQHLQDVTTSVVTTQKHADYIQGEWRHKSMQTMQRKLRKARRHKRDAQTHSAQVHAFETMRVAIYEAMRRSPQSIIIILQVIKCNNYNHNIIIILQHYWVQYYNNHNYIILSYYNIISPLYIILSYYNIMVIWQ